MLFAMAVSHSVVRIGELARSAGLSPDTLRHYERLGLLAPSRTPGRFREYGPEAFHRIRVIQAALAIGFTLAELAGIFAQRATRQAPCRRVRGLAGAKLAALVERIEELNRLRTQLERVLARWDDDLRQTPAGARARLLDGLADGMRPRRATPRTSLAGALR